MIITKELLISKKACANQVRLFEEVFPNGTSNDRDEMLILARKYYDKFDFDWAANNLLDKAHRKTYNEATAPYRKTYEEAIAPHRKTYDEEIAIAFVNCWFEQNS